MSSSPTGSQAVAATSFPLFSRFPAELQVEVWKHGLHAQQRYVILDESNHRVERAHCPTLFLVCKASKAVAERAYRRLQRAELFCERVIPITNRRIRGPIVSFEHDIFFVEFPFCVEKIWGSRIANNSTWRWMDTAFAATGITKARRPTRLEAAWMRFSQTPVIKKVVIDGDSDELRLFVRLSGTFEGSIGARRRSETYHAFSTVDEVWQVGNGGASLHLAGREVERLRGKRPRARTIYYAEHMSDGLFLDTLGRV